jgi:hypothetical protein
MTTTLDNGKIKVAGDADYELEVSRIVTTILNTQTGQAIATKIRAHGEVLIDEDYPGTDRREVNSEFEPGKSSAKLAIIGFHPHNRRLNTSRILYNGREITLGQLRNMQQHYTGWRPDEILLHEMVHAARYLGGDFKKTPIPGMPEYENEEEYFAILVTNIYIAQKEEYLSTH